MLRLKWPYFNRIFQHDNALEVYQVLYESMARSRLEAAVSTGLTPLVGREQEVALLLERWEQVKDGLGQIVLLGGSTIPRSTVRVPASSRPSRWSCGPGQV